MTINEREKKLLVVLGVVFAIALIYLLGYKPLDTKVTTLEAEVSTMEAQVAQYQATLKSREFYETEMKSLSQQMAKLDEKLPQALPQELVIQTMDTMSNDLKMTLPTLGFTEVEEIPLSANQPSESIEESEAQVKASLTGIKTSITTATTCSYDQLKILLEYIRTLPMEVALENLSVSSAEDSLAISFTMSLYGIQIPDRNIDFISLGEYGVGKFDLFKYDGVRKEVKDSTVYEGLFMILDPVQSDRSAITLGRTKDSERKTYLYETTNAPSDVRIELSQEGNNYYMTYQVGEQKYPEDDSKLIFIPGNAIGIQVQSAKRIDDTDLNEANVTIHNQTDKPVYIYIQKEDKENPRFKVVQTTGNVQVKE